MKRRRLMSGMGSSPEPAVPAYRRLRMPRKRPQVLGVDLNRSESSWGRYPLGAIRDRGGRTHGRIGGAPQNRACRSCSVTRLNDINQRPGRLLVAVGLKAVPTATVAIRGRSGALTGGEEGHMIQERP